MTSIHSAQWFDSLDAFILMYSFFLATILSHSFLKQAKDNKIHNGRRQPDQMTCEPTTPSSIIARQLFEEDGFLLDLSIYRRMVCLWWRKLTDFLNTTILYPPQVGKSRRLVGRSGRLRISRRRTEKSTPGRKNLTMSRGPRENLHPIRNIRHQIGCWCEGSYLLCMHQWIKERL